MKYLPFILCFSMLVFPYEFMGAKLGMMLLIILGVLGMIGNRRGIIQFDRRFFIWFCIYFFAGFLPILIGFIRNNPAPEKYITVYLLWTFVYFIYSVGISYNPNILTGLVRTFRIALIVILIVGIGAFLVFNFYPNIDFIFSFMFEEVYRPGYHLKAISSGSIISFFYLFSFFFTLFFVDNSKIKYSQLLVIFFGFVFAIATSRRALLLLIVLSPIIIFFFLVLAGNRNKLNFFLRKFKYMFGMLTFILILNIPIQFIDIPHLVQYVKSAYNKDVATKVAADAGMNTRTRQINSLIEGWKNKPIFGVGSGVNASVVRSTIPGTYEMSYHAMLFERGIFGLIIFVILIISLNVIGINLIRRGNVYTDYIIASIIAMNVILLANATNPYLFAYDHLWTLFFTVALLNVASLNQQKTNALIHE